MPVTEKVLIEDGSAESQDAERVIRSQGFPLRDHGRAHVEAFIEADVAMVQQAVQRRKHEIRAQAHAALANLRSQQSTHVPQVAAAEAQCAASPAGSWVLAVLLTPFCLACLGMEFVLSWVTLPLLFGVERTDMLGIMLGLGPTGAVAVLKVVIARLVEEPYQRLRGARTTSRPHQVAVVGALVLFAVALFSFNLYTLVLQADVREAIANAERTLRTSPSDYQPIDSRDAVVAVSVAAAVDGAIFFLLAWNEGQLWRRRRTAHRQLARARERAEALDTAVAQTEAALAAQLQESIDDAARVAGNRRRAELQLAAEQEEQRQRQARSTKEMVDWLVRRGVR
jgi:hypothetical protein